MSGEAAKLEYTTHAVPVMTGTGDTRRVGRMGDRRTGVARARSERTRGERFFRSIPEQNGRILRVAVNTSVAPWRVVSGVVSVFFDRSMKGKL